MKIKFIMNTTVAKKKKTVTTALLLARKHDELIYTISILYIQIYIYIHSGS